MSRLTDVKTGRDDPSIDLQIPNVTVTNSIDWNQIKKANMNDPTMVRLAQIIQKGWPETSRELYDDIKIYFSYRYVLHIVDGIIFLHDRIVVPIGLRQAFLKKIHDAHLGVVKSRLLGRTLIYWPNWNADIKRICQTCDLCREKQNMPANIPKLQVTVSHPGEIYGIDIADIQGESHLVCVNYCSCCIFERQLSNLHTSEIVKALKYIFCDIRAPDKLISNNARYFTSEEFQEFVMTWSIQHITSSL